MKKNTLIRLMFLGGIFSLMPMVAFGQNCNNSCQTGCVSSCVSECSTTCPISDDCCEKPCHSSTFFRSRPLSQDATLEHALTNYDYYYGSYADNGNCCFPWLRLGASLFYYQSVDKSRLAKFFLPGCKECINVAEKGEADFNSLWCGIVASPFGDNVPASSHQFFESVFRVRPERKVIGFALQGRVDFGDICVCDKDYIRDMWLSFFVPIVHVRHSLNMEECFENQGALQCDQTLSCCLSNNNRNFQQFYCGTKTRTGVDDINLKLGWDFRKCDDHHVGAYGILFVPTGNRSRAEYAFEPTIGSGKGHVGLGLGLNADYQICNSCNRSFVWMIDARYAYFLKARECRTFDLCKNGDWSRNLLLVTPENVSNPTPGVNFLTHDVDVSPRGSINIWTALHYQRCDWHLEFGYDFWWRQREKVSFGTCCPKINAGIFDITGMCRETNLTTASGACIAVVDLDNKIPASDSEFVAITNDDLDLSSAEHPSALSSKIYFAAAHERDICGCPTNIGFGISYEAAHRRTALSQVGLWVKTGISF